MPFSLVSAQPGEVFTLHPAHPIGIDTELLDPVLPRVCGRRVHRKTEPTGVALVIGGGEDDGRRALAQLAWNGERIEQEQVVADLDRV